MELAFGILVGIVVTRIIVKWPYFDIEADAFVNGYEQGYNDAKNKMPRQWEPWDALKWREKYPNK